jgi:hypothetical protein
VSLRGQGGVGSERSRLECVECGRVSRENERGWTVRLTVDDEVVVYCPGCDEREFSAAGASEPGAVLGLPSCDLSGLIPRCQSSRRYLSWW